MSAPERWSTLEVRGVPTLVTPAPPDRAEVMVHAGSLVAAPEELAAWKDGRVRVELPPATIVTSSGEVAIETRDGWPVVISRHACTRDSGELLEHRIVACYRFVHHVGVVLVRAPTAEALATHRSEIDEIVRSARPDFSGQGVIALSELWQL